VGIKLAILNGQSNKQTLNLLRSLLETQLITSFVININDYPIFGKINKHINFAKNFRETKKKRKKKHTHGYE